MSINWKRREGKLTEGKRKWERKGKIRENKGGKEGKVKLGGEKDIKGLMTIYEERGKRGQRKGRERGGKEGRKKVRKGGTIDEWKMRCGENMKTNNEKRESRKEKNPRGKDGREKSRDKRKRKEYGKGVKKGGKIDEGKCLNERKRGKERGNFA